MKKININSSVKVKLTDFGKRMDEKDHIEFWMSIGKLDSHPYKPPEEDDDGYCEFQLWELMDRFGKYCEWDEDLPFDIDILIHEGDLRDD